MNSLWASYNDLLRTCKIENCNLKATPHGRKRRQQHALGFRAAPSAGPQAALPRGGRRSGRDTGCSPPALSSGAPPSRAAPAPSSDLPAPVFGPARPPLTHPASARGWPPPPPPLQAAPRRSWLPLPATPLSQGRKPPGLRPRPRRAQIPAVGGGRPADPAGLGQRAAPHHLPRTPASHHRVSSERTWLERRYGCGSDVSTPAAQRGGVMAAAWGYCSIPLPLAGSGRPRAAPGRRERRRGAGRRGPSPRADISVTHGDAPGVKREGLGVKLARGGRAGPGTASPWELPAPPQAGGWKPPYLPCGAAGRSSCLLRVAGPASPQG